MQITVRIKQVYGADTIYPSCDKAKTFASMLGQKTLTTKDIEYIKKLGIEIKVEQVVINF